MIFQTSLLRNSFVLNREVAMKFLSHKLGSVETLALYGITMEGEGSVDIYASLARVGLSASSWEAHGGCEGGKVKLYEGVSKDGGV